MRISISPTSTALVTIMGVGGLLLHGHTPCSAFAPNNNSNNNNSNGIIKRRSTAHTILAATTTTSAAASSSPSNAVVDDPIRTNTVQPPPISPATNLPNQLYTWRSHQIRYQVAHPTGTNTNTPSTSSKGSVVLIHGLFVNSDHWRHTLKGLADAGYTAYAIDLLGSGYSSKPNPTDVISREKVCGELSLSLSSGNSEGQGESDGQGQGRGKRFASVEETIKRGVTLGTASGGTREGVEVDLLHPCESPYNFFTWAEQVADFTRDVVVPSLPESDTNGEGDGDGNDNNENNNDKKKKKVTLVANSIGTITALQSILDNPSLYNGAFIVNPNFRELHSAEVPFSNLSMPIIKQVQSLLRSNGQGLFDALAKPDTVKQILMEPYAVREAVDDVLVDVLLTPLLTPGASDVVFDTLSYSAGPLPEQQLREEGFPKIKSKKSDRGESGDDDADDADADEVPVWVCYGSSDPWTPPARVESLSDIDSVERVIKLDGVGHCPHDEAPELVNPLLLEFMERIE